MTTRSPLALGILVSTSMAVCSMGLGCTERGRLAPDAGGGGTFDANGVDASVPRADVGTIDPFDPDGACGSAAIPTERLPGSLLLVFDRSSSMDEDVQGHRAGDRAFMPPSKWDASEAAITAALAGTGDDLGVGLLLFPTLEGDVCDVTLSSTVPRVGIAPLSTNRSVITSALAGGPNGGNTPIIAELRAGYQYLDGLSTEGQRGLVLVTDGAENCQRDSAAEAALLDEVRTRHETDGYLTYAIGLDNASNFLSTVAVNGGTPRNDTCSAMCVAPITTCATAADCTGAATCIFGFCVDSAPADCCSYNASQSSFTADFQSALDEIASRFLDSCVFRLPRGADPSAFSPNEVNVGVTFAGESRVVLARGTDTTMSSWDFTSASYDAIILQGPICDRLLAGSATVEIVLGCPTLVF